MTEQDKIQAEHKKKVAEREAVHSQDFKGKPGGLKYASKGYARNPLGITITSAGESVSPGGTHKFFATVEGSAATEVIWSCSEGRIDQEGNYQAPPASAVSARTPTGVTITATAKADTSQKAHRTVDIC